MPQRTYSVDSACWWRRLVHASARAEPVRRVRICAPGDLPERPSTIQRPERAWPGSLLQRRGFVTVSVSFRPQYSAHLEERRELTAATVSRARAFLDGLMGRAAAERHSQNQPAMPGMPNQTYDRPRYGRTHALAARTASFEVFKEEDAPPPWDEIETVPTPQVSGDALRACSARSPKHPSAPAVHPGLFIPAATISSTRPAIRVGDNPCIPSV